LLEPYLPAGVEIRLFGPGGVRDFAAGDDGSRIRFDVGGEEVVAEFSFTARHHATNALAALFAVQALGLPFPTGRVDVAFSRWRGEESPLPGGGLLINDAYNANPQSMRAALVQLAERSRRRRTVAVLGEMAELGPDAERFHREIRAEALALGIGVVVGVGELAKAYGGQMWAATADDAVPLVRGLVEPGDVVLVKGSRAVGLERVADALAGVAAR
jgi:UDP-N-acetylmuramoyl-tripeptide--D-alanyl-D-alanine ligase